MISTRNIPCADFLYLYIYNERMYFLKFQQRLPHNFKEQLLFMAVISVISVNLIAPLITGLEIGFSIQHWQQVLH